MESLSDNNIKYEYKPFIGSSHTWAINNIVKNNRDISILDVGSSIGMMGNLLRKYSFNNIDAVEVDAESRSIAKKFYNNMYESLEDVENQYDLILLLDVLEHTISPNEFFDLLISKLNVNGTILLSVPNIAHWYPRFSLLFGNFNYTDKGILDRTHLHFYTIKTIKKFVNSYENLKINSLTVSTSPVEMFMKESFIKSQFYKIVAKIKLAWVNFWPNILGYQLLLVIKKEK